MTVERTIELAFNTSLGKTQTVRVTGAKAAATAEEISAVMDTLVAKDVFAGNNGALSGKKSARLVTRQTDDFAIS
jgi:uncharacterized Fe-S cluster-containing radical SAM superfamily protein